MLFRLGGLQRLQDLRQLRMVLIEKLRHQLDLLRGERLVPSSGGLFVFFAVVLGDLPMGRQDRGSEQNQNRSAGNYIHGKLHNEYNLQFIN